MIMEYEHMKVKRISDRFLKKYDQLNQIGIFGCNKLL
jgi:hypothetical protein